MDEHLKQIADCLMALVGVVAFTCGWFIISITIIAAKLGSIARTLEKSER